MGHKVEFNEVLSVLYREGQKMSWHDDGEPGKTRITLGQYSQTRADESQVLVQSLLVSV